MSDEPETEYKTLFCFLKQVNDTNRVLHFINITLKIRKGYLHSLDYLRGIAAVSVCLFHFTDKHKYLPDGDLLKQTFQYGHFGVEMFFIISGFVIPYALSAGSYTLSRFMTFMKKRILRIEPPYLLCVLLALALNYLTTKTPFYQGPSFKFDIAQIAYHVGYLNPFLGKDWLNPVFWTLAIEFQFYIFIALVFPLINHRKTWVWILTLVLFNIASFYFDRRFFFNFSIFFSIGILLFRQHTHKLTLLEQIVTSIAAVTFLWMRYTHVDLVISMFTAVVILLPLQKNIVASFFGDISYSLYLLHFPVGMRVVNLTQRFSDSLHERYLAIAIAFIISVIVSYCFYKIVEAPFKKLSQKISYRDKVATVTQEKNLV